LLHKAVVTGRKIGAGRWFWTKLADNEAFFGEVMRFASGAFILTRPSFRVEVDYDLDPKEAYARARCRGSFKHRLNREVFPLWRTGRAGVEIVLFAVVQDAGKDFPDELEMGRKIESEQCRPAKHEEVFALLEHYPKLGERFPNIVASGSHISAQGSAVPLFSADSVGGWEYTHYMLGDICYYVEDLYFAAVREGKIA